MTRTLISASRSPFSLASSAAALAALFGAMIAIGGCGARVPRTAGDTNIVFRNLDGTEVARGWLDVPARVPGPGQTFGGTFQLVSSREEFPAGGTERSGKYSAFVNEGGRAINFNLSPSAAKNNITLAGEKAGNEMRGTWTVSAYQGLLKPSGTFVMTWP